VATLKERNYLPVRAGGVLEEPLWSIIGLCEVTIWRRAICRKLLPGEKDSPLELPRWVGDVKDPTHFVRIVDLPCIDQRGMDEFHYRSFDSVCFGCVGQRRGGWGGRSAANGGCAFLKSQWTSSASRDAVWLPRAKGHHCGSKGRVARLASSGAERSEFEFGRAALMAVAGRGLNSPGTLQGLALVHRHVRSWTTRCARHSTHRDLPELCGRPVAHTSPL